MKVVLNWFEVVKSDDLQHVNYLQLLYSYITHVRAGLWEFLTKHFDVSGSEGLFGEDSVKEARRRYEKW